MDWLVEKFLDYIWNNLNLIWWHLSVILNIILIVLLIPLIAKNIKMNNKLHIKKNEHDEKIFLDSDKILNEKLLSDILNDMNNCCVKKSKVDILSKYQNYFINDFCIQNKVVENIYLNRKIKNKFDEFFKTFFSLYYHKDWCGDGDYDKIAPELKYNNNPEYIKIINEISDLVRKTVTKYKEYRIEVKKILTI